MEESEPETSGPASLKLAASSAGDVCLYEEDSFVYDMTFLTFRLMSYISIHDKSARRCVDGVKRESAIALFYDASSMSYASYSYSIVLTDIDNRYSDMQTKTMASNLICTEIVAHTFPNTA